MPEKVVKILVGAISDDDEKSELVQEICDETSFKKDSAVFKALKLSE